ncbi:MAG TPA: hypothetical protein VFQ53_14035 [Kofleriaceae bacterium]|nr:hypothetical protein [Kofleriaceae bacterium]
MRLPAVIACIAASACTGGMLDSSSVEQQNGACIALEGTTFASVSELECGLTPDGVSKCHWQIAFASRDPSASEFTWFYSDVGEAGKVECHGTSLVATSSRTLSGSFDADSQRLVFDGQLYEPAP